MRHLRAIPACLFAWLVPGGGHLFLGRVRSGLALSGSIGALFGLGLAMQARLDVKFGLEDPLAVLINVCQMATGAFYLAARGAGLAAGDVHAPSFEYGNTFTAVAGLLNMLALLDAYDVAAGRK